MNFSALSPYFKSAYPVALAAMACSGLIWGRNITPALQTLKAGTGLAPLVAAAGALKDSVTSPQKTFYQLEATLSLNTPQPAFAGLTPQEYATLLYGAFNTGLVTNPATGQRQQPTAANWDHSAPLQDPRFAGQFIATAIADTARFEIVDSIRAPEQGGLGAVAYRDKRDQGIHIFVVGLETDAPRRDTGPDLHSLLYDGMASQTTGLRIFVEGLQNRYPDQIRSLTGQSMGTLPASVVAYEHNIPYIAVEPRMNRDLANSLMQDSADFLRWYRQDTTAIEVGPNAWNRMRVTSLGEAPPVNAGQVLVVTDNGSVMTGTPVLGANVVGGPHQASKSVRALALGLPQIGLSAAHKDSLPQNAAEVWRARGPADMGLAGLMGIGAAAAATLPAAMAGSAALLSMLQHTRNQGR